MVLCNHPDADYQNACFNAYNHWLQEFVSDAPTRIFGIGQTALRVGRGRHRPICAGLRTWVWSACCLPGAPPIEAEWHSPVFDPLWEAAPGSRPAISFHTLASGRNRDEAPRLLMGQVSSVDFGLAMVRANQDVLSSFVLGGVFERFPRLKLVCVEAGAG
jgi:predicted TIM-barrel fold metal-dependent hydrolase